MATVSTSLERCIRANFMRVKLSRYYNVNALNLGMYKISLLCDASKEFFMPMSIIESLSSVTKSMPKTGTLITTLKICTGRTPSTSAESNFKYMLETHGSYILKVTVKDVNYYGNSGIIFDKDFNPLILSGVNVRHLPGKLELSPVVYVNPETLSRDDTISRIIVRKLLPTIANYNIFNYIDFGTLSGYPKILIEPFEEMIMFPTEPKDLNYSKEINEALIKHIQECPRENTLENGSDL